MRTLTPWAGSKRRLLKDYLPFFPTDEHFLDLFTGSGVVAANATAPSKHLNDVDGDWVKVLWSVTDDTDNFVDRFLYWGEQLQDRDTYFVLLDKLPSLKGLISQQQDLCFKRLVLETSRKGQGRKLPSRVWTTLQKQVRHRTHHQLCGSVRRSNLLRKGLDGSAFQGFCFRRPSLPQFLRQPCGLRRRGKPRGTCGSTQSTRQLCLLLHRPGTAG